MNILEKLAEIWSGFDYPFLIHMGDELRFSEIASQIPVDLSEVRKGDVVAIIGDFNPSSILTLLSLIDIGVIVVPLTIETKYEHEYFFESTEDFVYIFGSLLRLLTCLFPVILIIQKVIIVQSAH